MKKLSFSHLGILLSLCFALLMFAPVTKADVTNSCVDCHEEVVKAFTSRVHAVLDKKFAKEGKFSCVMCHGDAKAHIESEGETPVFVFKNAKTLARNSKCLDCHKTSNARFIAGPHSKAGMDCTSCHSIHKGMKKGPHSGSKVCYSCHQDVFAKFDMNEHHRLKEGVMSCQSCHDPHDISAKQRLGGFKHEACFKCHTDKQGPFLYEHGAVRVEGCVACHDVHGSVNRHMLTYQSVADLCYSCHVTVPGWHSRFTHESNCANCHLNIHGSNFSQGLIK